MLAGVLITARSGIAAPSVGNGFELNAIAAVVIGGASLTGGKGTIGKTVVGVFIMAIISNYGAYRCPTLPEANY